MADSVSKDSFSGFECVGVDLNIAAESLAAPCKSSVRLCKVTSVIFENESLNGFNGARSLSFDDLFMTRKFDGFIVKEENTYNNRSIEQYATGEYAAKESERIKNSIFNYEQDLWEY